MSSNIAATSPGSFSRSARAMTPPYGQPEPALATASRTPSSGPGSHVDGALPWSQPPRCSIDMVCRLVRCTGRPGAGGSEEAGALPFVAEDVLGEEGEDGLVPDPRVAGGEDPVVLVGEVEELGLGAAPGQVPPQPQRLADRYPVVLVAVDDQHRRADTVDVPVR